jgi:alpha-methylacyl-CoA racemase
MGPLKGLKVIELVGLGPGPFAGMLLADMGAEVIAVERASNSSGTAIPDCLARGKKSIALNLKTPEGVATLLELVEQADVFFEGFRPGVVEKLGVGPQECMARNPKLIYGRMTGWGQTGPLSQAAGHDINYISLTGALHGTGRANENPVPPLNLVGDFGGGGMFLVTGILAALYEVQKSGRGQVVDTAMTDGSAVLMAIFNTLHGMGVWSTTRGVNLLDTGAHFYETYETSDNKYVSVGSIEPQFYAELVERAGLDPAIFGDQNNAELWPAMKLELAEVFRTKTQSQWCELMEGTDVCFAPVLDFIEAQSHPHNVERKTYIDVEGMVQPAPAPRFSRTESEVQFGARTAGVDTAEVLEEWGFDKGRIEQLKSLGALS